MLQMMQVSFLLNRMERLIPTGFIHQYLKLMGVLPE